MTFAKFGWDLQCEWCKKWLFGVTRDEPIKLGASSQRICVEIALDLGWRDATGRWYCCPDCLDLGEDHQRKIDGRRYRYKKDQRPKERKDHKKWDLTARKLTRYRKRK